MTDTEPDGVVLMFDDESDRGRKAELLEERLPGFEVRFVDLKGRDPTAEIPKAKRGLESVDLILVDHVLDKTSAESQELVRKGSSLVPMLREHWDACPILALTAAYEACEGDISSEAYEAVFPLDDLASLARYLPAIIEGYRRIRESGQRLEALLGLLDVPSNDCSAMTAALPEEVKKTLGQAECAHYVFRWFWHELYRQPGFLYDTWWTSLLLGVQKDAFDRYKDRIADAEYVGVFKREDGPRWWRSKVYSLLLPDSPQRFSIPIQEAASERLETRPEDFSRCHRCGEKWPEVMACVDEASLECADMRPMHLRCTRAHSLASAKPYYEELRVMLEDKEK